MKASIDIGSNTVLLLVGQVGGGRLSVMYEDQRAPRLGQGVDAQKNLSQPSVQRVIEALHDYKTKLDESFPLVKQVQVLATSAVRDAQNKNDFLQQVEKETGWQVQILSGKEEARLTFLGAQSVLDELPGTLAVIDIGGGSTEIAVGKAKKVVDRHSFNIGSVRFTERYLGSNPPTEKEVSDSRKAIHKSLGNRGFNIPNDIHLVGVAGTVTSLAAIKLGHQSYQPQKLNGFKLSFKDIRGMISTLSTITTAQILARHPHILKGRADVFLAGLLILEGFMQSYDIEEVIVSTGGIRHGAFFI